MKMLRGALSIAVLAGALIWSSPAWVQDLPAPKSVKVDFPNDDKQFPGGAEAEAINNNCLACHSADMVLNQPPLPKATWEAEVHKMISVYKAPIDDVDIAQIVAYLVKTKGTN